MKTNPRILLLVHKSRQYGRGLVRGMAKYSRLHGPWTFIMAPEFYMQTKETEVLSWIKYDELEGVVIHDHPEAINLMKTGLPVVLIDFSKRYEFPNVATVGCDCCAVGRKGADHFIRRGFESLAFCGPLNMRWSRERFEGFNEQAAENGFEVHCYQGPWPGSVSFETDSKDSELTAWISSLPKPVGIMACNDDFGRVITDICRLEGFRVPDDVSILGVDNDTVICDLCNPPLSSIPLNTERAGYDAAKFLDMKIKGLDPDTNVVNVPILEIIERASTDIQATSDKDVANAIRFIRQSHYELLQVSDVASEVGINRRTLERKFRKIVGHGINDEIRKFRVKRIAKMLIETDMSITEIASMMQFTGVDHISRYFKKEMGMSPLEYRKQNR